MNRKEHKRTPASIGKLTSSSRGKTTRQARPPALSIGILAFILTGCLAAELFIPYDPTRMLLDQISQPPSQAHIFGTDTLGRDLFSVIWYGGRISLFIGLLSAAISTGIAVLYGTMAGLTSDRIDDILMRFTEILMSVPQILLALFLQAIAGDTTVFSMAMIIGITGWMAMAKMVRSEVKQLRSAGFVLAARTMGMSHGKVSVRERTILSLYLLRRHFLPNIMSVILFMMVTNIGAAIAMEATLSFMGMGLPAEILTWGSLLSLSQRVMLLEAWWLLLIPGAFLVVTLICITEIGEYIRSRNRREGSIR